MSEMDRLHRSLLEIAKPLFKLSQDEKQRFVTELKKILDKRMNNDEVRK